MGAVSLVFLAVSHNISLLGKAWWLLLVLRLVLALFWGFSLLSDEQGGVTCSTVQLSCTGACIDSYTPISLPRLWSLQLLLASLPHLLLVTLVSHRVLARPSTAPGRSGLLLGTSASPPVGNSVSEELWLTQFSTEMFLPGVPALPRFSGWYLLAVFLCILLELLFGTGQLFLFGLSVPRTFLCYEALCSSGAECFVSRATEKTLMLNVMLGVTSSSVLLSLLDLLVSVRSMWRWRKTRLQVQSSEFNSTSGAEDTELLNRRSAPSGPLKNSISDSVHTGDRSTRGSAPSTPLSHLKAQLPAPPPDGSLPRPGTLDHYQRAPPPSDKDNKMSNGSDKRAWV